MQPRAFRSPRGQGGSGGGPLVRRAGVEPAGHCGIGVTARSRQDSNLHWRGSRPRASARWATRACGGTGGLRTPALPVKSRLLCLLSYDPLWSARLELHQPALAYQTRASTARPRAVGGRGRIRTCTLPVLSRPPLPLGYAAISFGSSGWTRTNVSGSSGRRLGSLSYRGVLAEAAGFGPAIPGGYRVSNPVQ